MPTLNRFGGKALSSQYVEIRKRLQPLVAVSLRDNTRRIPRYDSGRLTVEVTHWRNRTWLDIVAAANNGAQLHCRRLRVWRWEHLLVQRFGKDWEAQAEDKEKWERESRNV